MFRFVVSTAIIVRNSPRKRFVPPADVVIDDLRTIPKVEKDRRAEKETSDRVAAGIMNDYSSAGAAWCVGSTFLPVRAG